jgi:hypothetical protein
LLALLESQLKNWLVTMEIPPWLGKQSGMAGVACILVEDRKTHSRKEYGEYSILVTRMT